MKPVNYVIIIEGRLYAFTINLEMSTMVELVKSLMIEYGLNQSINNVKTLITQTIDHLILQIAIEMTLTENVQTEITQIEITQTEIIQTMIIQIEITQTEITRTEITQTEITQIETTVKIKDIIITFVREIISDADSSVVALEYL